MDTTNALLTATGTFYTTSVYVCPRLGPGGLAEAFVMGGCHERMAPSRDAGDVCRSQRKRWISARNYTLLCPQQGIEKGTRPQGRAVSHEAVLGPTVPYCNFK